jgi:hypothetical protein
VPALRTLAVGAICFGALTLFRYDPIGPTPPRSPRVSKQLIICLDVSPSMQIIDAGPQHQRTSRAQWAGRAAQAFLEGVDINDTRISLIGFYSSATPILIDTYDKEVVAHALNGLPFYTAFEPGPTDLAAGIHAALEMARPWARDSTALLVVSDGDAEHSTASFVRPPSIADAWVLGVGDVARASSISSHASRQDAASLKLAAARLGGTYYDANRAMLPRAALQSLRMTAPRAVASRGDREIGLIALTTGASLLAALGPALMRFGAPGRKRPPRWDTDGALHVEPSSPVRRNGHLEPAHD